MPHDSTESKTAYLTTSVGAGNTNTVSMDAQEDRRIVGWDVVPRGIPAQEDHLLTGKCWIGTEPNTGGDRAQDLGGKFWDIFFYQSIKDDANGNSQPGGFSFSQARSTDSSMANYDWNEDATLNLKVDQGAAASTSGGFHLFVEYVEADDHGGL